MSETQSPSPVLKIVRIVVGVFFLLLAAFAGAYPFIIDHLAKWMNRDLRAGWLPVNLSVHGTQIDLLFDVIFSVTAVVMVGVMYYLVNFCITYRYREGRKAHFSHGNKRLELIWTAIPAVILLGLALWTKGAWDNFRYSPTATDPNRAQILVVGEQFRWNVVYPGPDKKLGRYLQYPKVTDAKWPALPPDDADADSYWDTYKGADGKPVPGPAFLPVDVAQKALNEYISAKNRLGKDFSDPDGKDDDWKDALSRPVYLPKGRPVEITLSSKDVLHSFFLPDFRVKLDAVPGMKGRIYLTATRSSAEVEKESLREYSLDDLQKALDVKRNAPEIRLVIPPGKEQPFIGKVTVKVKKRVRVGQKVEMVDREEVQEKQVAFNGDLITNSMLADLKTLNVKSVTAFYAKSWNLVCAELCGNGHTAMQGQVIVLEPDEYQKRFEPKPEGSTPPPAPPVASATAP